MALPEGLLAAGSDLSVPRLAEAYSKGIFPWFNEGDPVLWWSPDPRMVLACRHFRISRSLAKKLRQIERHQNTSQERIVIKVNTAFDEVIEACAGPRTTQSGTWISQRIMNAYREWHEQGRVHSVETWVEGRLVGGLYGVCLGGFFFGESMFAYTPDSSKIALAYLVRFLERHGVTHIDCQQDTRHLARLGAQAVPRAAVMTLLRPARRQPTPPWQVGRLLHDGRLCALTEIAPSGGNDV